MACSLTSRLTFFLTGNLTLSLVSTELSLETLEQYKLNSTAFSKPSKFRLKPHGFTDLKIHKVSLFKLKKMDFGSRASIKLTFIPFNDEFNSAINCSEVAVICSCEFTSLAVTAGYRRFCCQTTRNHYPFCPEVDSTLAHLDKNFILPIEDGFFVEYF